MSGPFSARQLRVTSQRAYNLADAAIEDSKRIQDRLQNLESDFGALARWAGRFSHLSFWQRLRWLMLGR